MSSMAGHAPTSWEQRSRPNWMVGDARPETHGRSRSDDGVLRGRNTGQRRQHGRERKEGQEGVQEGSWLTGEDVGVLDGDEADRTEERRGGIGDSDVHEVEGGAPAADARFRPSTRQQGASKGVSCSRVAAGMGVGELGC
jgi:hypothetical protein